MIALAMWQRYSLLPGTFLQEKHDTGLCHSPLCKFVYHTTSSFSPWDQPKWLMLLEGTTQKSDETLYPAILVIDGVIRAICANRSGKTAILQYQGSVPGVLTGLPYLTDACLACHDSPGGIWHGGHYACLSYSLNLGYVLCCLSNNKCFILLSCIHAQCKDFLCTAEDSWTEWSKEELGCSFPQPVQNEGFPPIHFTSWQKWGG